MDYARVKLSISPQKFSARNADEKLSAALTPVAKRAKVLLERTVSTWRKPPEFVIKATTGGRVTVSYNKSSQAGKIYTWVDQGTPPHAIQARDWRRPMTFNWGGPGSYKAKSKPGKLFGYVGTGGANANQGHMWKMRIVYHPGVEPRNFKAALGDALQPEIQKMARKVSRIIGEEVKGMFT